MKKLLFILLTILPYIGVLSQHTTEIELLSGDHWWGGAGGLGSQMPYIQRSERCVYSCLPGTF